MSKMAVMPLNGKKPSKIFFLRTSGPISTKLGIKHWKLNPILFCSNNNPGVDLELFYVKVKIGNLGFYMGKCDFDGFSENC